MTSTTTTTHLVHSVSCLAFDGDSNAVSQALVARPNSQSECSRQAEVLTELLQECAPTASLATPVPVVCKGAPLFDIEEILLASAGTASKASAETEEACLAIAAVLTSVVSEFVGPQPGGVGNAVTVTCTGNVLTVDDGGCNAAADAINRMLDAFYHGRPGEFRAQFCAGPTTPTTTPYVGDVECLADTSDIVVSPLVSPGTCPGMADLMNSIISSCSDLEGSEREHPVSCSSVLSSDDVLTVDDADKCKSTAAALQAAVREFAGPAPKGEAAPDIETIGCVGTLLVVQTAKCTPASLQINALVDGRVDGYFPGCSFTTVTTSPTTSPTTTTTVTTTATTTVTTTPTTTDYEAGVVCQDIDLSEGNQVGSALIGSPSKFSTCEAYARVLNAAVRVCQTDAEASVAKEVHCITTAGVDDVLAVDGKASDCQTYVDTLQRAQQVFQGFEPVAVACFGNIVVVPGDDASVCDAAAAEINGLLDRHNLGMFKSCTLTTTTTTVTSTTTTRSSTTTTTKTTTTISSTTTTISSTTTTSITTTTTTVLCDKGQVLVANGCVSCPAKTFQDAVNHRETSCKTQTVCNAGEKISVLSDDSKVAARTCSTCGNDPWGGVLYQDKTNHREEACKEEPLCGQGTFSPLGTNKEERTCEACPANTFTPNFSHRNTACTVQTVCQTGEKISADADDSARTCSACGSNEYQDATDHRISTCKAQTVCARGEKISSDSNKAARTCSACPNDTFQDAANHRETSCKTQATCGQGQRISADSDEALRTCSNCGSNSYQSLTSHRQASCKTQTVCQQNQRISSGDSRTAARTCSACPANSDRPNSNHRITTCIDRFRLSNQDHCGGNDASRATRQQCFDRCFFNTHGFGYDCRAFLFRASDNFCVFYNTQSPCGPLHPGFVGYFKN